MKEKGFWSFGPTFYKTLIASLAISVLGSWGTINWLGNNSNNINLTLEGISTCFNRVSQNYSEKMIGVGEKYSNPNFFRLTEECYSDLEKVMMSSYFLKNNNEALNYLKSLVKKVYWFHRVKIVENEFLNKDDYRKDSLTTKYKEVEELNEKLLSMTGSVRSVIDSRKTKVFYLGGLLISTLVLISIFKNNRGSTATYLEEKISLNSNAEEKIYLEKQAEYTIAQEKPTPIHKIDTKIDIDSLINSSSSASGNSDRLERFDEFFNRYLRMIGPRLIRRGMNIDINVDANIPRVLYPQELQSDLEVFFEKTINFNLNNSRICRVDCTQIGPELTEIRYFDNGLCLLKTNNQFKNVRSSEGMILGVEYKQNLTVSSKKKRIRSLFKGSKKDLLRDLQV